MFLQRDIFSAGHLVTKMSRRGADQKSHRIDANNDRVSSGMELKARDQILEKVDEFKYPGRMMSFDDSDWPAVVRSLLRARRKWGRFYHLLGQDESDTRNPGRFYMAALQFILIFGLDSWVIMPLILRTLVSLHNWVALRISRRIPW